jgi:hypothetical protein
LDIHGISIRNNVHIGVGIASSQQDVLKAEGEQEHAAGIPFTHAAMRQEGRGVRRRSANEEVSVLEVNPLGEWEKLGGAAGNSGKYSGTGDLVENIAEMHLNRDTTRVCTNARTEGVSERWCPARDPRTKLQRGQARPNIRSCVHDADAKETEQCFTHSERADTAARLLEGNKVGGEERRDVWQGALKSSGGKAKGSIEDSGGRRCGSANVLIGPAIGTCSTTMREGGEDTLESVARDKGCIAKSRGWVGNGFRVMERLKGLEGSSGGRSERLHLERLCSAGDRTKSNAVVDGSRQTLGRGARACGKGAFKSGGHHQDDVHGGR